MKYFIKPQLIWQTFPRMNEIPRSAATALSLVFSPGFMKFIQSFEVLCVKPGVAACPTDSGVEVTPCVFGFQMKGRWAGLGSVISTRMGLVSPS